MAFTKTSDEQVPCTCGRFYHVGDYCGWCQKTVEAPPEKPAEEPEAALPEGEQLPAPEQPPAEEPPAEDEPPPEEDAQEPAAADALPHAESPIATPPPPPEGRRSRRER
jgi:hypothetical protein